MRVEWAEVAQRDLADLAEQAYETDPDRADRLLAEAGKATEFLGHVPFGGSPQDNDGLRKLSLGRLPYIILYVVQSDRVYVTRLHHSSQNWRK